MLSVVVLNVVEPMKSPRIASSVCSLAVGLSPYAYSIGTMTLFQMTLKQEIKN